MRSVGFSLSPCHKYVDGKGPPVMGKPNANRPIHREPPKLRRLNRCFRATVRNLPESGRISGAIKLPHFCWDKEQLEIIDSRE